MSLDVDLQSLSLNELFDNSAGALHIPEYQRTYCWLPENVFKLLDDIWDLKKIYHLGSVILQHTENGLNIIDGQQRLITLTLILDELMSKNLPLLDEKIESEEAVQYIAYNKQLISNYINRYNLTDEKKCCIAEDIRSKLVFAVLTLKEASLDLAYTFFSSQNSKGVKLTSYELLKAHHLHYISNDKQAKHMAKRWDVILSDKASEERIDVTMGKYLFRMRKWLYKSDWDDKDCFKVKKEFVSAEIISEIPPFGEKFIFNEPIQGGTHFFAYTDRFINHCYEYHQTKTYKCLRHIKGESHKWFKDVIEALLFAYYLKFGDTYMPEAFICISKAVSQYRYESKRIEETPLVKSSRNNMIMFLVDQASSPTFFLAALRSYNKKQPIPNKNGSPIMERFAELMKRSIDEVKPYVVSDTFLEDEYV